MPSSNRIYFHDLVLNVGVFQKVRQSGRGEEVHEKSNKRRSGCNQKLMSLNLNFSMPISFSTNFRSSLSHEIPIILQWAAIKVHPRGLLCVRYSSILPGQKH